MTASRAVLPLLLLLVACGRVEAADPVDGPCAERFDPVRDDERTVFGARPNQVRVRLSGTRSGELDGAAIDVTPVWTGGFARQVWAERTDEPAPDPAPPLWCEDRFALDGLLRIETDDARLAEASLDAAGTFAMVGTLDAPEAAFVGTLPPEALAEPADAPLDVWLDLTAGRGEVRVTDSDEAILEWSVPPL